MHKANTIRTDVTHCRRGRGAVEDDERRGGIDGNDDEIAVDVVVDGEGGWWLPEMFRCVA
jgi:hypothetical protein